MKMDWRGKGVSENETPNASRVTGGESWKEIEYDRYDCAIIVINAGRLNIGPQKLSPMQLALLNL